MNDNNKEEETYFKCSECNEFHIVPSSDKPKICTLEHRPNVDNQVASRPDLKYCQSCIERGFKPPNPATREWETGIFFCEECFDAMVTNLTMIPKQSITEGKHQLNGKHPVLDQIYSIFNVPESLQFDRVDTVCRNYEKLFNFRAPSIVNKSLDELTIELEAMKSTIFYIQYFGEPNEIEIKRLKEVARKEKQLSGVKDTAEAYVKDKKPSKVKTDKAESLAAKLGVSMDVLAAAAKTAREKEFKNITGVCSRCGTSHKTDECPPGVAQLKEVKKPVQPILSGNVANVLPKDSPKEEKVVDISREAMLAKARLRLNK